MRGEHNHLSKDFDPRASQDAQATLCRLAQIVESSDDAILSFALDGTITSWNAGAAATFGYTAEEMIGRSVLPLIPPDLAEEPWHILEQIKQGQQVKNLETVRLRKNGQAIHVLLSGFGLRDAEGKLVEVAGILRDITGRKQLEEQFLQSQKMDVFGRLAGGVAHDFNNLLTVINGYTDFLLNKLSSQDPSRPALQEICRAARRAADLTHQLLAFSRKQVLLPEVVDLNVSVKEMVKMLRRLIGEDIIVSTDLDPSLRKILMDLGQLNQVIINLAVNARDAMPKGGCLGFQTRNLYLHEEAIPTHLGAKPGAYVMLAVSDTGCGMNQDTQAHLFEPFFTTKGPGKGTGLGLATVNAIIQHCGGFITVHSEVGLGTAFHLYLPAANEEAAQAKATLSFPGIPIQAAGNEIILLVEDDDRLRFISRTILQGLGYTVLEASHGEEALQRGLEHNGTIHLLITDVVLPGIGGPDLGARLSKIKPRLKVLYISGYMDDALERHGLPQVGFPFLSKPFTPKTLALKVREVLDSL